MFSITKNWIPLDKSLYTRDEKTKTLSTNENYLVLDFSDYSDCTFKTGSNCTFKTGYDCTFKTGSNCTFDTGSNCVVVRRDIFEVIILKEEKNHIKLNWYNILWYTNILEEEIEELTVEKVCKRLWKNIKIVK
jgi:hypothetical protein